MVNVTALATSMENTYILFRIELLVVVSTLLFLGMSIVDIFRGHFHSSIVKALLGIIDNVSDSVVLYVMGTMQTAPFKNQLFPVWAIVLVGFRHSMDFISAYGIRDKDGRSLTEWRNVLKLLPVAFLNKTRGSMFVYPLWSLWGLQMVRSNYRLHTRTMASNSVWHGKSSELVSEYMRTYTDHPNFKYEDCKAETMEGYRYLVYGETGRHVRLKKPRYVLQIDTNPQQTRAEDRAKARAKARGRDQAQIGNSTTPVMPKARTTVPESLVTLDKIWQCNGALLKTGTEGDKFKDMSLAFSLSRLLRCRLEDVALHKGSICITRNLVKLRIIEEKEANRAFGVMELEMAFLNDYLSTRYPMVFWCGLPSLHLSLIMSIATFVVACWLSVDIRRVYKTPKGEVAHVIKSVNVDMIITWFFMFFMMFKEIWEMVSYCLSDWTRLLLACTYARWASMSRTPMEKFKSSILTSKIGEKFMRSFLTSKIDQHRWHGVLDQYVFLQSYEDSPSIWNLLHIISTGALPKKDEGATLSDHIPIPECVKPAILAALRSQLDITRDHLLDVIPSLVAESRRPYRWVITTLPTSTHIILVWHIATCLCEIKLAQDLGIDLSSPGLPRSAWLYLKNCCSCSTQPYPVNIEDIHGGDDEDLNKTRYIVANSLSRYCAYLLVAKPYLLPDSFLVPKMIFQETVHHARSILKDCDSLDKRYRRLMDEVDAADKTINVVQRGAKLAKELIGDKSRWEILAGVWADLLVHIAPSWNTAAHKKCIEDGGEFITHIWALLSHCGIEKSMLWPVEGIPKNNAPGAPDNNAAEENGVQPAQGMRQAEGARERDEEQGMLTEATTDGRHMSGLVNGHSYVIRGTPNLGNTCYFNAALQCLLALFQLRTKMLLEQDPPSGRPLHLELKKLFQLTSGANYPRGLLGTENFFSELRKLNQDFNPGVMEDSHNLLVCVLNGLKNEEPSMVESLFHGQVVKEVSGKCLHTSVTTEDHLHLSLAIPSKENVSVEDCLDFYASGEVKDWYCTACSAAARNASSNKQDTTEEEDQNEQSDSARPRHQNKQSSNPAEEQTNTPLPMLDSDAQQMEDSNNKEEEKILRAANIHHSVRTAPTILIIQLKRYDCVHPGRSDKLEHHANFQEMLDITKLMEHSPAANEDYKYCLVAVIVHNGSTLSDGHIFSYVRATCNRQQNGASRSWFRASDENVTEVSIEEVLKCQAYILFYERVEQSEVKKNPETDSPTNQCREPTVDESLDAEVPDEAEKAGVLAKEDKNKRPAHPPDTKVILVQKERGESSMATGSTSSGAHSCQPTSESSSPPLAGSPRSRTPAISPPAALQLPRTRTASFQDHA